jgi:cell division protein FtsI/penicillin-binding protein 2
MSKLAGYLLDFSIGQYDTYTPIQLMQYINTIANGGYRLKPYLLKAVYNPTNDGLTSLAYENEKTILNKVNIEDKYMERIRAGFREVMTSGTGSSYINSIYNAAGKTGTSESFIDTDNDGIVDTETMSNTFGAYAPYDNPTVSFLVVSPNVYYKEDSTTRSGVNKRISYRISQKYFEIYK